MTLARIEWLHLRNLATGSWCPDPGLNLILGENGSGKTSLLEGIHLLGRGRSFQTTLVQQLIRHGQTEARVTGTVSDRVGFRHSLGVQLGRGTRELHLDGCKPPSSVELLRTFPIRVISPVSTTLLKEGPRQRRQFLDFGVFYENAGFLEAWRRYMKVLGHRNALLREKKPNELEAWNQELERYGTMVAEARACYGARLLPLLQDTVKCFLPAVSRIELKTAPGWNEQKSLIQALRDELPGDLRQGYTQSGPHRGDFSLGVEGRSARAYLSRGQTKLLVYALILAQSRLMEASDTPHTGCLLIDDLASELDGHNRNRLVDFLAEQRLQCFITATDATAFNRVIPACVHLEQGRFRTDIIQSTTKTT
jgi:DNA replication and repair protein RecF